MGTARKAIKAPAMIAINVIISFPNVLMYFPRRPFEVMLSGRCGSEATGFDRCERLQRAGTSARNCAMRHWPPERERMTSRDAHIRPSLVGRRYIPE